ncbi:MAG: hypothetical protein V4674_02170 [Patescibacteria group bacterium]
MFTLISDAISKSFKWIEGFLIFRLLVLFLGLWFAAFVVYTLMYGLVDPFSKAINTPGTGHVAVLANGNGGASNTYLIEANGTRTAMPLPDLSWAYAGERKLTFADKPGHVVQAIFVKKESVYATIGSVTKTIIVEIFPTGVRTSDIPTRPNLYQQSFFDRCLYTIPTELPTSLRARLIETRALNCQDPANLGPLSIYALQKREVINGIVIRTWYYVAEQKDLLTQNYREEGKTLLASIRPFSPTPSPVVAPYVLPPETEAGTHAH